MHYIIGTSFTVTPAETRGSRYGRFFTAGESYRLLHIIKDGDQLQYAFQTSQGNRHTVTFNTGREADQFIATCKRESIPDYEKYTGKD